MSGIAIMMMVLFMVVIWGGLLISALHLRKNPDERSGELGTSVYASDDLLTEQESA
ncbi:methionine/alanine import NSS transporter subunit MetS [Corynebacterium alimapuense]|uniref:Putative methionine/alanine importer small subunit n=1 Tax=Corynebacterium alimapuense TaxID=1576874 RepID=A0A3M8K7L7_9CORY|nr:methionine/alanine import NSS transporter subunit MetS [Corynebacterium alimapuense]RNE48504.1 putative methionine/alanine importer small subunit [Corynebacterium alimapuense]